MFAVTLDRLEPFTDSMHTNKREGEGECDGGRERSICTERKYEGMSERKRITTAVGLKGKKRQTLERSLALPQGDTQEADASQSQPELRILNLPPPDITPPHR